MKLINNLLMGSVNLFEHVNQVNVDRIVIAIDEEVFINAEKLKHL